MNELMFNDTPAQKTDRLLGVSIAYILVSVSIILSCMYECVF